MKFKVEFKIDTNYTKEELTQVIERLLSIPGAEYEDCNEFESYGLKVEKI